MLAHEQYARDWARDDYIAYCGLAVDESQQYANAKVSSLVQAAKKEHGYDKEAWAAYVDEFNQYFPKQFHLTV